jgi:cation diffusion facilitator family transporter
MLGGDEQRFPLADSLLFHCRGDRLEDRYPPPPMDLAHDARLSAGRLSLVVGTFVFMGKVAAWIATGSVAVFSDAMESIVNVVAALLLVWSLRIAAQPADRDHPYGHGKAEFLSAAVEGALIIVAALLIGVQALRDLIVGAVPQRLDTGMALVAAASLLNGGLGLHLVRVGRRTHSAALVADGRHILTDVWTSAGVLLGLLGVSLTGWVWLDPAVALAVAANIVREGWRLVQHAVGGLMDEADVALLAKLAGALEAERPPEWIDAHGLRAWRSGAELHADLHLVVPRYFDAERLHGITESVEERLRSAAGLPTEAVVHFDPCRPHECARCGMPACPVRSAAFVEGRPLTLRRATRRDADVEEERRADGA